MSHWETFAERTDDPICRTTRAGRITRSNAAFDSRFPGGSGKCSLLHCTTASDAGALEEALGALTADSPNVSVECADPEGNRWTQWHMTLVGDDDVLVFGRDVTEHHQATLELRAKEAFLSSVIENEPECVKIIAPDGTLLDMNAAGLRMVGAEAKGEVIGQCVYDIIAPADRERFEEFNGRVCSGERGELCFDIVGLNGRRRSMETVAVPLRYGPDRDPVHLAITRDVSERLRLEDQLRQAQKMEAIGRLAGGIAHDFNNLLTAIIGPAELALKSLPSDSPVAADLRQIQGTAERAAQLTHQLLAFARRQLMQPESVKLGDLVEATDAMLRRIIGERYRLETAIGVPETSVYVDRGQLEQVLVNLVVNARDSMPEGGTITILTREEAVSEEEAPGIGVHAGRYGVMTVVDNGSGIPPEIIAHVFEPFFTTKEHGKGTGLGLATCYGIARQAGGAIRVESSGDGTTFDVYIPSASGAPTTGVASQPRRITGGTETVVVVEDEPLVRKTLVRTLDSLGYDVVEAGDGASALRAIEGRADASLIITDVMMPGMTGPELVNAARRGRDIGVLYITGYSPANLTEELRNDAQTTVLQKPFTTAQVDQAIRGILDAENEA